MTAPAAIRRRISTRAARDGAGVNIRRIPGDPELDPFLLLDEFGSDDPDDYIAGFPEHPHRGFETVTYMLAGHMRHRDSVGNEGRIGPGDVQWMTAGRGIVHSEMPAQESGLMRGFQLWVNLPASEKMTAPRYQEVPDAAIPRSAAAGVEVKVVAGAHAGVEGAVRGVVTDPTYLDVVLTGEAAFEHVPGEGHTVLVYVYEGRLRVGDEVEPSPAGEMAVLGPGAVRLAGSGRALLLAARPIGEPVVQHGPFVMNSRAEIEQAIADYRAGLIGR